MANNVFANGREISCKASTGTSLGAFPDVCFTPPQTPATPLGIPVPYPNSAFATTTTSGSRTVKISGKEAMLKNKSYFKTSTGDDAGCAPNKGVVTSTIRGKAYFVSWSVDVKIEGQNVVRHLDLTTHNHSSPKSNSLYTIHQGQVVSTYLHPQCQRAREAAYAGYLTIWNMTKMGDYYTVVAGAYFESAAEGRSREMIGTNKVSAERVGTDPPASRSKSPPASPRGRKIWIFERGLGPKETSRVKCRYHPNGFRYRRVPRPKSGDAEAKIMEALFRRENGAPAGTLYMYVHGRPVCCSCQELIKCAQENSNLRVLFCMPVSFDIC